MDSSKIKEMFKIQIEEVEMLQSMFSIPGEFQLFDPSVIIDIHDFLEGKSEIIPPHIDFVINLITDGKKLVIHVNLPSMYPDQTPEIYVRNDCLKREQLNDLNKDLFTHLDSLDEGEIKICRSVAWLQENAILYFTRNEKESKRKVKASKPNLSKCEPKETFSRFWIYSHHIRCTNKRKSIIDSAQKNHITGFCVPGKPGIICIEGRESDIKQCWLEIRSLNWQKIMCIQQEDLPVPKDVSVDSLRKFELFKELTFESEKNKQRDMGEFYKFLSKHDSEDMFKVLFGVDGKFSNKSNEGKPK